MFSHVREFLEFSYPNLLGPFVDTNIIVFNPLGLRVEFLLAA